MQSKFAPVLKLSRPINSGAEKMSHRNTLRLREIITVVPAEDAHIRSQAGEQLAITHRYLLVASRDRSAQPRGLLPSLHEPEP